MELIPKIYNKMSMLGGSLVTMVWCASGCGWRRSLPDMEGVCEYIE